MSSVTHPPGIDFLASFGAGPSQSYGALPPNKGMQLTIKSDTPFAKRRAKGVSLLLAADPRRYVPYVAAPASPVLFS